MKPFAACLLFLITINLHSQQVQVSSIYYKNDRPCLTTQLVKIAAKILLPKNSIKRKLNRKNFTSKASPIPAKMFSEFVIDTFTIHNRMVYSITPKEKFSGTYVLFLHGGGYINNIFRQHWNFISEIIRRTHCTFIVPDYPLAPVSEYHDAFLMLDAVYKILLSETDAEKIILLGDSAGGGLALSFAQNNRNEGRPQPSQLILVAPWLDITMSNPEIINVQDKDVSLTADNLIAAGKTWAGDSDPGNYMTSPVNGTFDGLPGISILIGTHDILYPDCIKLKGMMDDKGISLNFFEYPEMFHDWVMLVSLKESKIAIAQICSLINQVM